MPRHCPPPSLKERRHYTRPRNVHGYLRRIGGRIFDLAPDQLDRAATETLRRQTTRRQA